MCLTEQVFKTRILLLINLLEGAFSVTSIVMRNGDGDQVQILDETAFNFVLMLLG